MPTTHSEYDGIGSQYINMKRLNFIEPVENYTIDHCLLRPFLDEHGLLTGKRVLDLACGYGYHTRRLQALNCAKILGVDISHVMIDLARDFQLGDPANTEYLVVDAKQLPLPKHPFDLTTGFYLLNYCSTREELLEMACSIYAHLGEGKPFVDLTINVIAGKDGFDKPKYGIQQRVNVPLDPGPIPDGTEVSVTLSNEQDIPICMFSSYYFLPSTYEDVFKDTGFRELV